ncbi:DUF2332 domain-containing protein [Streptomyces sp. NPDC052396]|uniref:DUF2332 domain-containing protein n=1 Tax=Streptomyces sp. NPDC052396 TaxID=3365689 RepID=UPI0037D291B1
MTYVKSDTGERYRRFAAMEVRGHSPSYEELASGVAEDPELLALIEELPWGKRQPNLLLAAVRFSGGPVLRGYPAFREWTLGHWERVRRVMLERLTQTNEPARCATRLPQPLALIEVGASAGLCLYPDRYRYRYDDRAPLGPDGAVELSCRTTGPVPFPERLPRVVHRAGVDLNPLDVRSADDMRWLETLVWPEQRARLERLRAAVPVARAEPPRLVTGDLNARVRELVAAAPAGATTVVFHSAVLACLPPEGREEFAATMRELPVHWVSNEATGAPGAPGEELRFTLCLDERPVARTGPHGQTLDWLDGA